MIFANPSHALAHHVTGAIARGQGVPIVEQSATPAPCPCQRCNEPAGPFVGGERSSRYLARHKAANPHNFPRVQGWPALSPSEVARRDAEAQGRAAPHGEQCPPHIARPGSAWAAWWAHGNGPARHVDGERA